MVLNVCFCTDVELPPCSKVLIVTKMRAQSIVVRSHHENCHPVGVPARCELWALFSWEERRWNWGREGARRFAVDLSSSKTLSSRPGSWSLDRMIEGIRTSMMERHPDE